MAIVRVSSPLAREVQRLLPSRPFSLRFWDGGRVPATRARCADVLRAPARRRSRTSCARPGTLGLGRAYVEGSLEIDDLDGAFVVVDEWEPPPI